jgi:hypothetical protein
MPTIQEAARDAAISLNNAAIRADEATWREVCAIRDDLERMAESPTQASVRRLGLRP